MITFKSFKNVFLSVFLSVLFANVLQAQKSWVEQRERYKNSFDLTRESVFLHLNKTSIAPGEDLWLAAYIYDPRFHMPNQETMNLDLGIYGEEGNYMETKVVYISNGKGVGFIPLDPKKFTPGIYFIKASTNYMNNFEEDLSYTQPFEVLGEQSSIDSNNETFDLQLLAEGGHLLAGVENSVGVRLINSRGDGVAFDKAVLLDEKQAQVTTLESNKFGISRFFFVPEVGKEYTLRLRTGNGEEIEKKIAGALKTGISMVSTPRDNHFLLSIRTNPETRKKIGDKNFHLAFHRDGKINAVKFNFPADKLERDIMIRKHYLFPGVNTITIFDEDLQPLLERLIFNEKGLKRSEITGSMTEIRGDSVVIQLASAPATQNASLSVSILPSETLANNPYHNIYSAFWLKPYIKGTIDEPAYYFTGEITNSKRHDLDLLLLTQGWRKYNWKDLRKNEAEEVFNHNTGFNIAGRVEGRRGRNEESLLIRSDQEGLFEVVPINEDNSFKLENIYVANSTALSFSFINEKKKKMSKPSIHVQVRPMKKEGNISVTTESGIVKRSHQEPFKLPEGFIGEAVLLDTVMISSKAKVKERTEGNLSLIEQKVEITEEIVNMHHYIKDYIATQGFRVQETHIGGVEITSRFRSSIILEEMSPLIYFNGARIGPDFPLLSTLRSSEVESIVISRRGNGEGMNGVNGVIKINTKKGGVEGGKQKNVVTRIVMDHGFNENKAFYTPKYTSYTHSAFKSYGTIGWLPNLFLDKNGQANFKVFNVLHPEINLYIEGMTADGVLFSDVITVETK